jgi:hypothetical protein
MASLPTDRGAVAVETASVVPVLLFILFAIMEYAFSAQPYDVTTWKARVEGNPVHLTR